MWARRAQQPFLADWRTWLVLGGRGAGKTRMGAEWIRGVALADPHQPGDSAGRIALVGQTYSDVRDVMVEGESGLLRIHPRMDRPAWRSSRRELQWPNGAIAQLFSASDPDSLRGNQFGAAWCDELTKWNHLEATWDMLQFALRLGTGPRQIVTTTPRPVKLLRRLLQDADTVISQAATWENRAHLAPAFLDYVASHYSGTRLGRQELEGEIIEEAENALWQRDRLEKCRRPLAPELKRIVIAVDPPASSGEKSASCGIIAAGKTSDGHGYVLADATIARATPERWATRVVELFGQLEADLVVVETNQGGEMVKTMLRTVDANIPVREARANRGKWVRAEPVALLYERGLVHHVGTFPELEDQMCNFGPDGMAEGNSPDRLDAMVWAMTELMLTQTGQPRVHVT